MAYLRVYEVEYLQYGEVSNNIGQSSPAFAEYSTSRLSCSLLIQVNVFAVVWQVSQAFHFPSHDLSASLAYAIRVPDCFGSTMERLTRSSSFIFCPREKMLNPDYDYLERLALFLDPEIISRFKVFVIFFNPGLSLTLTWPHRRYFLSNHLDSLDCTVLQAACPSLSLFSCFRLI